MTLLCHQRHFGTWAAQESVCLPESVGGWNWMTITSVDESSEGQKVGIVGRKGTIWSHLRWYGHYCCSPGATMRLRHFRHVPTDLQGRFNSVFLCTDTQVNPPATWPAPPLPTEGDWPRINGLLSWDAHIQRNLMHAHLCKHRADAAGTWSQCSSPGVPAAASAPACPLSDSLTFNAAATHRSARTGRAREGIRDREWSIKEAA